MKNSFFIVVSGPPGAGKTTLGKKIAKDLEIPFMGKDIIKESLFDSLGWHDREWSKKMGLASIDLLYIFLKSNLKAKRPVVIENAFITEYERPKLIKILKEYNCSCIEIFCYANKTVLLERFLKRDQSGNRHSGHIQQNVSEELKERLENNVYGKLNLSDKIISVNMNNFDEIAIDDIIREIITIIDS